MMKIKPFQLSTQDLRAILDFKDHEMYKHKKRYDVLSSEALALAYEMGYRDALLDAVKYIYTQMRKEIEDDENRINESISRDRTDAYSND